MFTKIVRVRLTSGGDRRARLCGGVRKFIHRGLLIHRIATVKTAQDGRSSGS